jgi:CRISPR-associated protein Csm1
VQIEHIFNGINRKNSNNTNINSQEFEKEYIEDYNNCYQNSNYSVSDDFSKKYYESLKPSKQNSIISKYDDEKIDNLVKKLGDNLLMISGDFWGIQKFIFDGLVSKNASKILRSRSAMVQLITFVIVDMIKKEFKDSDTVLFGAGKFLILARVEDNQYTKLNQIQKKLDNYFLQNFFGQNGFIISTSQTTKDRILSQESGDMKKDLESLAKNNESKKLNKFDFQNLEDSDICIDVFANSDDDICEFCRKRAVNHKKESCIICENQIKLGTELSKNRYLEITNNKSNQSIEIFDNYYANFSNKKPSSNEYNFDISSNEYDGIKKWSLNSYVALNENSSIKTFEELSQNSQGLIALKADVDKLGDTFRDFYMTSFKKFNRLSRELDFFFSDYATNLMKNKKLYTVFAGGDDLFLIGEYKEVIEFAKVIREKFYKFALEKSTLSMGLVMFKSSTPINYISHLADQAEARAKAVISNQYSNKSQNEIEKLKANSQEELTRDGIDIFGISMKFGEFLSIENEFSKVVNILEVQKDDTTSFYYRLIDFCNMKDKLNEDITNAMWKSKLNYVVRRNIKSENQNDILNICNNLIENYGKKLLPSIFIKLYKNRDKKGK